MVRALVMLNQSWLWVRFPVEAYLFFSVCSSKVKGSIVLVMYIKITYTPFRSFEYSISLSFVLIFLPYHHLFSYYLFKIIVSHLLFRQYLSFIYCSVSIIILRLLLIEYDVFYLILIEYHYH